MSTNFPTSIDTFTNPASSDPQSTGIGHAAVHTNANDAIAALEAKVGVNGSAVTTSLDYKINHLPSSGSGDSIAAAVGVTTIPRACATNAPTAFSGGFPQFTGFVSPISFTAGHINVLTNATAVPTHAYLGLYSVDASGNLTQIAVTADTVAIGTAGAHKVALITPVALTAGLAYAVAFLTVGTTYAAISSTTLGVVGQMTLQPFSNAYVTAGGATVLPASATFASLTFYTFPMYAEITV